MFLIKQLNRSVDLYISLDNKLWLSNILTLSVPDEGTRFFQKHVVLTKFDI